ncbi:MAG TPA: carboxypeptidase regulatory-like domain-containing protein [Gemmatimonadaceae bacterium]|nr:carboxypeptidase regulatory-like domain-containing protein [Gemmatimonadaceae bacterium]
MKVLSLVLATVLAQVAGAQSTNTNARAGAIVSGVVRDSIAKRSLAGADVQLVAADDLARVSTVTSDSQGRFAFADVRDGRYTLGFLHPMLDSLGLEPPVRALAVENGRAIRIDIGIPSARTLRSKICGAMPSADTSALMIGIIRSARDASPVENAKVSAEWLEFTFMANNVNRRIARLAASSGENGWFAMCNVPSDGTIAMIVSRGADSTDLVEVKIPSDGFLRRDLYLGTSRVVAPSARPGDTTAAGSRVVRYGDGRLTGKVITEDGRRPIPGARVSIPNGPQTQANDKGEWTLTEAPTGTRMLEVRSLGFYPAIRRVDVIAGSEPMTVSMSTLRHVLDTVTISATRLGFKRDADGFARRQRSGMGRYITAEQISRRDPIVTSDMFRYVPGLRVESDGPFDRRISMRGAFGYCRPALFLNDREVTVFTMDDLDGFLNPRDIKGIEIYTGGTAPPQFQPGMSGCGSIVVWTK